jgi:demethylspheroidene O-methyltransferase
MVQHHAAFYADLMDPVARLDGTAQPGRLAAFWPYAGASDSAENAPQNGDPEAYSALMTSSLAMLADDILDAYPFGQHHRIMDVGGGEGEFLIALARRHAAPRLLSFDLPAVAARATQRVERAGLAGRIAIASGNFLDCDLPEAADLITLVRIAHDHHDDNLLRLLSAIRRALAPGGALVIAEPMSGDDEARRVSDVYFAFYLHAMGSGRVRRPEELEALVRRAGFTRFRRYKTARPMLVSLVAAS